MLYIDKFNNEIFFLKDSQNFGFGYPFNFMKEATLIYTQDSNIFIELQDKGYNVKFLSSLFLLPETFSLFDIYNHYFNGSVKDNFEMALFIYNAFIIESENKYYCFKIGATYCWVKYTKNGFVKLGKLQFSKVEDIYNIGDFMRKLNYEMTKSGVSFKSLVFYIWNENDLNREYYKYIVDCKLFADIFNSVIGLNGLSCLETYKLLSNTITFNPILNAENFVFSLNDSFRQLDIKPDLSCKIYFYKDYSKLNYNNINFKESTIFLIIDCEGKKGLDGSLDNGVDKIGGLICCYYRNYLINLEEFSCDEFLIEETFKIVFNKYKQLSHRKEIDIITYGTSDKRMLLSSLKWNQRNKLIFTDSLPFIRKYLTENNITIKNKLSLSNIAKELYVAPIYPKHNPVNDSRTLFNILSRILYRTKEFLF